MKIHLLKKNNNNISIDFEKLMDIIKKKKLKFELIIDYFNLSIIFINFL
jgi:hypothetical protein